MGDARNCSSSDTTSPVITWSTADLVSAIRHRGRQLRPLNPCCRISAPEVYIAPLRAREDGSTVRYTVYTTETVHLTNIWKTLRPVRCR